MLMDQKTNQPNNIKYIPSKLNRNSQFSKGSIKNTKRVPCLWIPVGRNILCRVNPPLFYFGATETASVIKALLDLEPIGSPGPPAKSSKLLSVSETREMAMLMGAGIVTQRHPFTKQTLFPGV